MNTGYPMLDSAYHIFLTGLLILMAVLIMLCLFRAIKGPKIADRIVAVNMMGTMVMVTLAGMAVLSNEGYLVDVALIYAMTSFLAVIVLSRVYMSVYLQSKERQGD